MNGDKNASMGTATEVPIESETSYTVDVIEFLMDFQKEKIPVKKLAPHIWTLLFRKLFLEIKQDLHYLHQFQELLELIPSREWGMWTHPGTKTFFSKGISSKTRVLPIAENGKILSFWKMEEDNSFWVAQKVLLSDSGKFILASFKAIEDTNFKMLEIVFKELDDDDLSKLILEDNYCLVLTILECLKNVLEFGIQKREEQLIRLKSLIFTVNRMRNLITI